jgi:4'-phosphopantetheinyl transferase
MSVTVFITSEFSPTPAIEAEWLAQLPLRRRSEIAGWSDQRARRQSLLGSRLLSAGLTQLGFEAEGLDSLSYGPLSRPTLDLPVEFSLSHCEGRVVCALSTCGPVGIDVEALGDLTAEDFRIYLSPAERSWAARSARRFYSVWTRKEAVAKAAGHRGLRDVARVDTGAAEQRAALDGCLWRTWPIPAGRRHLAHLAMVDQPCKVTVRRLARGEIEHGLRPAARVRPVAPYQAVL